MAAAALRRFVAAVAEVGAGETIVQQVLGKNTPTSVA
jgi:hypothetical protein